MVLPSALAILVLPVFARRWFPFAGPAAFWLFAGELVVDPLLIPHPESAFLLGLRDRVQAVVLPYESGLVTPGA